MQLWSSENQYIVEKYYETYLFSIKYILGYSIEALKLADEFKNSDGVCKKASDDIKSMNLNPTLTKDIYKTYNDSMEEMSKLRKGFYCILCDARTQEKIRDYLSVTNLVYSDRTYFSQDFCKELVNKTIKSSFFTVFYLKRFSENLAELINCKTGLTQELVYDVSYWTKQSVKNCYYYKDKYFFFFCEDYCQDFHIVKPSGLFDGDLYELKKFVDLISANKNKVFTQPNNNILMYMLTYEDDVLEQNFKYLESVSKFFTATNNTDLSKFKTDVVYFGGGMNPWENCETSLYPLNIAGEMIVKIMMAFVTLFVL